MKNDDHALVHDCTEALAAYLQRVDIQLARAGLDRTERNSVCHQIVEQFHDILPVPAQQATPAQIESALASLSSDAAFAEVDVTSRGQILRMFWHRFWIGTPSPIVLNDHGKKRIMWAELIKRLGWLYVILLVASLIPTLILLGKLTMGQLAFVSLFTIMLPLMIFIKLHRTPVDSLPHVVHWPAKRIEQHRFTGVLIMIGSFVSVFALIPCIYCLSAMLSHKAIWPVNQDLFFIVMITVGGLGMLLSLADAWRRRQRHMQLKRWAAG